MSDKLTEQPRSIQSTNSIGLWLAAFGLGHQIIEPNTTLALYDCAARAFGIDRTRSVHAGHGIHDDRPLKEDRRAWLSTHLHSLYAESIESKSARLSIGGRFRDEYIWYYGSFTDYVGTIRSDEFPHVHVPYIALGVSLANVGSTASVIHFCQEACQHLLQNNRIAYGLIDLVDCWHPRNMSRYFGNPPYGSWEYLFERHMWKEFLCPTRQHACGVFWGNIFGREMADRLRAAGLHEMLAFNRDFHPRWDAIVIDGEHGGQAILLDDDPVLFAQKRGGRLIAHDGVVQNGIVLRAAMMKAGLM